MTDLIIYSLSVYYIVQLLVFEQGPFDVFEKIRFFLGVNQPINDMNGNIIGHECNGSFFATLISCYVCTSFWVSVILCTLLGNIQVSVAVAAVATILHRYFDGD